MTIHDPSVTSFKVQNIHLFGYSTAGNSETEIEAKRSLERSRNAERFDTRFNQFQLPSKNTKF